MPSVPRKILFVCLGNICRSPAAEAVFRTLVANRGLDAVFEIDSVGTGGWHEGERADPRSRAEGERRGHDVDSRSRQVVASDLDHFEFIICMDRANHEAMTDLGAEEGKLHLLLEWHPSPDIDEVPDPYYGGEDGFVRMYELIEVACGKLLEEMLVEEES
tara:strand:+ start:91 stop:570 length:480 start_codon:yes stop_codon:yes gene_type:complete